MQYYTIYFTTNLWVYLNNLEVATYLLLPFAGLSQEVFKTF